MNETMNLENIDYSMIAGLTGVILYLLSYALLQLRIIAGNTYLYPFMNAAAAAFVLISLMRDFNAASALIQISFITFSAVGIFRLFYIRNQIKFSDRETALLETKLNNLSNDIARKMFDAGQWVSSATKITLCTKGEPTTHLYYIEEGECEVTVDKKIIGKCCKGDFVGEITCFNGEKATGTVTSKGTVSMFRIDAQILRQLCTEYPQLRFEFEHGIADNLRAKIARSNGIATNTKRTNALAL